MQGLLRQANSATHGAGSSPILRVEAAIDRIGLVGTRAVAVAAAVDGLLSKPGGVYDEKLATAWQCMVNTGPVARALAPAFGADGEEAFAIALLHDVGLLIIFDRISVLRAANRWGLGIDAADAIGTHHRRDAPAEKHPLAEAMFVADHVVSAAASGAVLNLFDLWYEGQLTGDQTRAQGILDQM